MKRFEFIWVRSTEVFSLASILILLLLLVTQERTGIWLQFFHSFSMVNPVLIIVNFILCSMAVIAGMVSNKKWVDMLGGLAMVFIGLMFVLLGAVSSDEYPPLMFHHVFLPFIGFVSGFSGAFKVKRL